MNHPKLLLLFGAALLMLLLSVAPAGASSIPDSTISPDHRYGVIVPSFEDETPMIDQKNRLVEIQTGHVLAVINANTGWKRMNHGGVLPSRWSPDGSLLLWEVEGKWSPHALVFLRVENGRVKWQLDILKTAQEAILARTKQAVPQKYEVAKRANAGNGSAYPEGFTIDVEALDPIGCPLRVRVALTSNPKGLEGHPNVESALEGIVDENGVFKVTQFHLGPGHSRHF